MEFACTKPRPDVLKSHAPPEMQNIKRIGLVLFDGFALPDTAAVIEIFHKANALVLQHHGAHSRYEVSLLSTSGGRVASSSAVYVWTERVGSLQYESDLHRLFIAGGISAHRALHDELLIPWLRRACHASATVHPIAEGRLLYDAAEAKKCLDPQMDRIGAGRPEIAPRLFDQSMRPVRAALDIVEEDLGAELAQHIAQSMAPQGNTPPGAFFRTNAASDVSDKINASARWLDENVGRSVSMELAAKVAAMSERNFLRRFKNEMGMTPSDYLLYARLNLCCRMLVETRLPVDKIARHCGIGSGEHLAKLFRKHLSTTPTEYRKRSEVSRTVPGNFIKATHSNPDASGMANAD
ncbi:Transcriptional regulator GlxA family, contains an amidase domain and an AraC-type DNA-binding HTH domain [Paraburkholderia tuberum]|uniref:Transcriptional regulator GlxA family, contains an amidase domain and an AraC-type DNA-binding HTH domain n=2 Tax=Paraburkholderia tuberum TaxID=157910 RepID=A0A1H1KM22_9BURK|nr:Transcriptional regulator GlxA family, contains an amidase domain and an AraC-type DNA-binding HTH domain [Paraburkholderia tuberum]